MYWSLNTFDITVVPSDEYTYYTTFTGRAVGTGDIG
jgi:hypothetical protein